MIALHIADAYGGKIKLRDVTPDPANKNMVYGLVVNDYRGELPTGSRVWISSAQVAEIDPCPCGRDWCGTIRGGICGEGLAG